jgi:hypothetical protein
MAIILNSRDTIQERNQYQLDRLFGTYVSDLEQLQKNTKRKHSFTGKYLRFREYV